MSFSRSMLTNLLFCTLITQIACTFDCCSTITVTGTGDCDGTYTLDATPNPAFSAGTATTTYTSSVNTALFLAATTTQDLDAGDWGCYPGYSPNGYSKQVANSACPTGVWGDNGVYSGSASCVTSEGEGDPCFPSDAHVTLANGTAIRIDALKEGDSIVSTTVDGVLSSDAVTLLSIAQPKATSPFVLLSTADSTITLTDEHHLPVGPTCCNTLKKAKDVALGEMVWLVRTHGIESALVTKKSTTYGVGLHSPVLMNGGFPVVDGFVTAFDSIDKVYLAKSGLASLLKACKATGTCEQFRNMFFGGDAKYIVLANATR